MGKLADLTQTSWYYFEAENPDKILCEAFMAWLDKDDDHKKLMSAFVGSYQDEERAAVGVAGAHARPMHMMDMRAEDITPAKAPRTRGQKWSKADKHPSA